MKISALFVNGFYQDDGSVVLAVSDAKVANGARFGDTWKGQLEKKTGWIVCVSINGNRVVNKIGTEQLSRVTPVP